MSTIFLRIVPASFITRSPLGGSLRPRRPQRMIERHIVAYRRQWLIVVSGFFEPLFYLLSMRAGLGDLVGTVSVAGTQVSYAAFVAPALMAASAMNGAIFDATGNVLHRLKYARIYDAALATPMEPVDVAVGEIGWALIRGQLYAISFLGVMAGFGLVESWWALLTLPACALIGLTFASIGFAGTTFMRGWTDMDIVNTAMMPLFLFSATFSPPAVTARGRGWCSCRRSTTASRWCGQPTPARGASRCSATWPSCWRCRRQRCWLPRAASTRCYANDRDESPVTGDGRYQRVEHAHQCVRCQLDVEPTLAATHHDGVEQDARLVDDGP